MIAKLVNREFIRFFRYFKQYKKSAFIGLACVPITIFSSIFMPLMTIDIVDNYISKGRTEGIHNLIILYFVVFLFGYIAGVIYDYLMHAAGIKALRDYRHDLFAHVIKLPKSYFEKVPNGVTLSRLTTDFETINDTVSIGVAELIVNLIKALILYCFLIYISFKLSIIFSLILPVLFLIGWIIMKKLKHYYNLARSALAESVTFLSECLQGFKTMLFLNIQDSVEDKYAKKNKKFLKYQNTSNFYEALLFSLMEGIGLISIALILWVGSGDILTKTLSIGTMIAFYQTMLKIFAPIRELVQQASTLQRAFTAILGIEKLFKHPIDQQLAIQDDFNDQRFESLEFKNVSFRYQPTNPLILKNINFKIEAQQRLAFVGSTGSGKSTILKLLIKQYHNYEGSILLNGKELKYLNRKQVLNLFSFMHQDTFLFNENIYFNIALQEDSSVNSSVEKVAKHVQADRFIGMLPDKYGYLVLENGRNLSIGQSQMIGLARAYFNNKEVFVFDEATAAIDSLTEKYIEQSLQKILQEKTVIAVAHRLSTIKHFDKIILIDNGTILEQGAHEDLIKMKGTYYSIVNAGKKGQSLLKEEKVKVI